MKKVLLGILFFAIVIIFSFLIYSRNSNSQSYYTFKDDVYNPSQEALTRFSNGLKIKTISNPDYKKTNFEEFSKFINYIKNAYPLIFQKCEFKLINNYAVVLKLKGKSPQGLPNLITAHYDVVGIKNEANWKYPPFSGYFDNEYIYSRGTLDDKGSVFAILEALNELLNQGFQPQNDLYVAFCHAEETGSDEGAPKIVDYFKINNITFNSVLDEGGEISNKNENYCALIGIAEKGRLLTKVTTYGTPSHAAYPSKNAAVSKLAKIITAFSKTKSKSYISKETKEYYKTVTDSYGRLTRFFITHMSIFRPFFLYQVSNSPEDRARLSSTYAITVIEASNVQNAVSADASCLIDARIIPEETTEDVKKHINKIIKKALPNEKVKLEYLSVIEPSVSNNGSKEEFEKLSKIIRTLYPNLPITPTLILGATDARTYCKISNNTFRFLPCILTPEELNLMHNDNEKISLKNWGRMITFYKEYILSK